MKNLSLWIPSSNTSQLSTKLSLKAYQWNQFVLVLLKCNIFRYYHLWENARERLSQWCKDGKLQVRELTGDLKPLWEFVMEEKQSDIFNQSLSPCPWPSYPGWQLSSSHRSRVKALRRNVTSFWWEPRPPTARPSPEMVVVCFGYNGSIFTDRLHSQHSISQYGKFQGPRSEGDIHTSKNSNVDIISIRLGFCSYRKPFHRKFAFNCWCTFIGRAFPTESSGQTKYYQ